MDIVDAVTVDKHFTHKVYEGDNLLSVDHSYFIETYKFAMLKISRTIPLGLVLCPVCHR